MNAEDHKPEEEIDDKTPKVSMDYFFLGDSGPKRISGQSISTMPTHKLRKKLKEDSWREGTPQ